MYYLIEGDNLLQTYNTIWDKQPFSKKCDIWQKQKLKNEVLKFGLLFGFTWSSVSLLQEIDS